MRKLSVRVRLTIWFTSALAAAMVILTVTTYAAMHQALERDLDLDLKHNLASIGQRLHHEFEEGDEVSETSREVVRKSMFHNLALQVYGSDRKIIASSHDVSGGDLAAALDLASAPKLGNEPSQGRIESSPFDAHGVEVAALTISNPVDGRNYYLVGGAGRSQVNSTLALLRRLAYTLIPLLMALAIGGGWIIAGRALAPVASIAEQARAMGADRLGDRLAVANPDDELGRLASVLNELLDRIEAAFDRMRQFVADASHELRTPAGVIRSGAAVALTPPVSLDECVDTLRIIDDQAERLGRLVDDMFTLARADAGDPALIGQDRVPLGELIATCAAAAQPLASAAGVKLEFSAPRENETYCSGDRRRLEQMLINLLTNAIRHSGEGGRVMMELEASDRSAAISVSDTGPGVPFESRGAIFERFVRLDAARSREKGGSGLGLPIAKWVAEAHGGSIAVADAAGGGAEFTVRLPIDDQVAPCLTPESAANASR